MNVLSPDSLRLRPAPGGVGTRRPDDPALGAWIDDCIALCEPDAVFYCDGSDAENDFLLAEACRLGVLTALNQEKLPGCYAHRSDPNDVARVEQLTFICTPTEEEAGPTNNWSEPAATREKLRSLLAGSMRGRTMFVVPYLMGPAGSPLAKVGVEITDSIYVVLNLRKVTRMGAVALDALSSRDGDFNRGLHSMLDLDPARRFICHFPQDNEILSVGSGYGGNVLLGKKCFSLRVGSYLARDQGWMAEHMLLLSAESPTGEKHYIAAAFPSACGKTNFAMLIPPAHYAGWKIRTIGDDIAWMQPGPDGRLWAVNPESGYFGVIPGTNAQTNPNAMATIARDTIYTNVATLDDGDVWWEGKDGPVPAECTDWQGRPLDARPRHQGRTSQQPFHLAHGQQPRARPGSRRRPGRADLGHHLRRAARGHRAARLPIARLDARGVPGRDDGQRDDRRRRRGRRAGAARPDGDAAVLRLPHGRLFRPLARHGHEAHAPAADLRRELVPARRAKWEIPLARLRRKHARARMDHRPVRGPGGREGDVHRRGAGTRGFRPDGSGRFHGRAFRAGHGGRSRRVAAGGRGPG